MSGIILTIDIGTSACKAAVYSGGGEPIAGRRTAYPLLYPGEGMVEQDPEEIVSAVCTAVESLSECCDLSSVAAVSFSAQASAQLLVDAAGIPLTNLISWMDRRAHKEAELFTKLYTREAVAEMSGLDMIVTPAYSLAKMRWMRDNIPEIFDRASRFVQIKDYLIHKLTGNWVSDATSLKGLVNARDGRPIPEVMDFIGASAELLPDVALPYDIAGGLLGGIPGFDRLPEGTPVVVGWNDMNAAFLGMGALRGGIIGLDLTGTSEHLGYVAPFKPASFEQYQGVNRVPFIDGHEAYYGVTSTGGQTAEWFVRDFLGQSDVAQYFGGLFPGADEAAASFDTELICLPYIAGERNPFNAPDAKGVFFGLKRNHSQIHAARAVLEGVCFALRTIFDRFPEKPHQVIVSGGASRNDFWNQMKADILGVEVVRTNAAEAGCTGALILAEKALDAGCSLREISNRIIEPTAVFRPDERRSAEYEKKYVKYLELYNTLKPLF